MPRHHDINVPLAPSSSSSKRRHQAHSYQTRLQQLGYQGVVFCHTAYGRLKEDKDDADVALPWRDLLPPSTSNVTNNGKSEAFGRANALGMKVYRRLNVVVEEVGDVSRILLPADARDEAVPTLLQKYDVVSLQPMNEPALQNICELLSPPPAGTAISPPNSSVNIVDIIVLEYATGSRGGHGLPYKLRKDYLAKALQAGATFEVCYGAAVLDPKRRQGFLRTLLDFRSSYNAVQKKHALLNKQYTRGNGRQKSEKPLLLSSGARQNYTLGTGDVGALAFRAPRDVKCLVGHLVGDDGWFGKGGEDGIRCDDEEGPKHNKRKVRTSMSAAERVLARASDRALGVVSFAVHQHPTTMQRKRQKRSWESRSLVVDDFADDSDNDGETGPSTNKLSTSLVNWLSEPLKVTNETEIETTSGLGEAKPSKDDNNHCTESEPRADPVSTNPEQDTGKDDDDIEDGFIAL